MGPIYFLSAPFYGNFEMNLFIFHKRNTSLYFLLYFDYNRIFRFVAGRFQVFQAVILGEPERDIFMFCSFTFQRNVRDPRFDDLSGTLNETMFEKSYGFLSEMRQNEVKVSCDFTLIVKFYLLINCFSCQFGVSKSRSIFA